MKYTIVLRKKEQALLEVEAESRGEAVSIAQKEASQHGLCWDKYDMSLTVLTAEEARSVR